MIYGYARVSTKHQDLQRQIDNIRNYNSQAVIYSEKYTGTKLEGREELDKLVNRVKAGDTIIFDEVSRMSRNATEGSELYESMFNAGVNIEFIKDSQYNTDRYRTKLDQHFSSVKFDTGSKATDKAFSGIFEILQNLIVDLAKEEIFLAFQKAEDEATRIRQRVTEGMAKTDKAIGRAAFAGGMVPQYKKDGTESETWKRAEAIKKYIRKNAKAFGGILTDDQCIAWINDHPEKFGRENLKGKGKNKLSKTTYYKYKKQILQDMAA